MTNPFTALYGYLFSPPTVEFARGQPPFPILWVGEYVDAVNLHGLGSPEAEAVRRAHEGCEEFIQFADGFDNIKRHFLNKRRRDEIDDTADEIERLRAALKLIAESEPNGRWAADVARDALEGVR